MNFRLSVINSIRSLEKSIFGQICLFLSKISPMASKKRKLEIDEDDLIAGRIDGIEWKPLQKDSVDKIRADYVNPCSFLEAYKNGTPIFYIKCTTPSCRGNGKKQVKLYINSTL